MLLRVHLVTPLCNIHVARVVVVFLPLLFHDFFLFHLIIG